LLAVVLQVVLKGAGNWDGISLTTPVVLLTQALIWPLASTNPVARAMPPTRPISASAHALAIAGRERNTRSVAE